jgi:TonB family protein
MTIQPRNTAQLSLPTAFVEAFDGLLAGAVGLDFTRRALASTIEHHEESADDIKALIDAAYEDTRLSDEDYEALSHELTHLLSEDVPTDWSEAAAAQTQTLKPGYVRDPAAAKSAERAAQPLYPGAILRNRFVLQSRTAVGSMGEIYKALDRRKQEVGAADPFVAIKVISPDFDGYSEAIRVLQHEAALGQRLGHPNIARVLDFDRDGEHAFVTLEWLEGESLGELLTRLRYRPVATARSRQVLEEIGGALAHAHQAGIVHGDVKPGNIYLTSTGTAKLLDFGAARSADTPSDTLTGKTPAYASCEVLEGAAPTRQDDVYSLACVAYRMLAGNRAFGRLSASEAERAGKYPPRIMHLTDIQWRALSHALAFRRAQRPASVEDFLREFGTSAFPAHVPPHSTAPPPVIVRIAPRQRLVASAAALVGCGVVLAMLLKPPSDAPLQAAAPLPASTATGVSAGLAATTQSGESPARVSGDVAQATVDSPSRPSAAKRRSAESAGTQSKPARTPLETGSSASSSPVVPPPTERTAAEKPKEALRPTKVAAAGSTAETAPATGTTSGEAIARVMSPELAASPGGKPAELPPTREIPAAGGAGAEAGPAFVQLSTLRFTKFIEPAGNNGLFDRNSVPGWVVVSFHIDTDGRTDHVGVIEASPKARRYESAAMAAVRRWRFEPVIEGGRPVERQTTVRIRFEPK